MLESHPQAFIVFVELPALKEREGNFYQEQVFVVLVKDSKQLNWLDIYWHLGHWFGGEVYDPTRYWVAADTRNSDPVLDFQNRSSPNYNQENWQSRIYVVEIVAFYF